MKTPLEIQLENAYKIFKNNHERLRENLMDSILKPQIEDESETEQSFVPRRKSPGHSLGEIIMDSRIFKIAAGIIIVGIVSIALKVFTGTDSIISVAFGDVLKKIQNSSYTFDITTIGEGQENKAIEIKVHKSGKLRWDSAELFGGLSMICDLKTGERLLLYTGQKLAANMKDIQSTDKVSDSMGPFNMLLNPIENLWNLRDGTETPLGEKEIKNKAAIGFKIQQKDENYSSDIIVWASKETGNPILVEIILHNPDNPSESETMKLNNFNMNAELDEKLFSMKPPEGYTMAYQKTLDETAQKDKPTIEADKIQQSIKSWSEGEQDKALEILLSVDWTKSFTFTEDMYLFYLKDKDFVQLKQEDQQKAMQEINNTSNQLRNLCRKIWELSQEAVTDGNYESAEKYLNTTLELGRLINRDPELAYTSQMIGHSIIKKSLTELEQLYKANGNQEKLQQTQQDIKKIDSEIENLKDFINNFGK